MLKTKKQSPKKSNPINARYIKKMLSDQLMAILEEQNLSRSEVARQMKTNTTAVRRLLDPQCTSMALHSLAKMAHCLGKSVKITIE